MPGSMPKRGGCATGLISGSVPVSGAAAIGAELIHSPLLFQGGNILCAVDPKTGERILLVADADIYRNTALGLTAAQAIEAFRVEFGCDRCEMIETASFHLDYDISVRAVDGKLIAMVNDPKAAAKIILQAAMPVTTQQAETLLDELTHSILIRTPNGIAFQMRSYGEYLAAVELRSMSLERIQQLVNYEHTFIPNESWRNCISYLAELHQGVRRSFAIRNPDWVMAASPAAFTEAERTAVMMRQPDGLAKSC